MTRQWTQRHRLAEKRLRNILRSHAVASARTLEQKISDAGPRNQRIHPHILTEARNRLIGTDTIKTIVADGIHWYHLAATDPEIIQTRLSKLGALHRQTQKRNFTLLLGQALEIATYKALRGQSYLNFFGHFPDLDAHDDSTRYRKVEPPSFLSDRQIPEDKKLDFLVHHPQAGFAGIEVKNVREWFYPNRSEIREFLLKCCALDVVPVLIARRIHFSTFSVLNPCGVILHETFNQLYPSSASALAEEVKNKTLLGYHDVRVGNEPDRRLLHFVHRNLPKVLLNARQSFDAFKDLLSAYGNEEHSYKSFAARVKRRVRGEPEDLPDFDDDEEPPDW